MEIPKPSRIMKWLFLLWVYFLIVSCCASCALFPLTSTLFLGGTSRDSVVELISDMVSLLAGMVPFAVLGGIMGAIAWAYTRDKKRELVSSDDFKDDNLLFRYGNKLTQTTLPIPVMPDWTDKRMSRLVNALQQTIATQIRSRFSSSEVEVTNPIYIKDRRMPRDNRNFLKIVFRSRRGSQISHFTRYEIEGKLIVAHYFTYIRGSYKWHDIVDFVITGPLHVWFWVLDWIQNQYSIIAAISKYVNNSFDQIDLKTFFEASYFILMSETRNVLREEGLLSEELDRIISVNIDNSQKINITGSQGITIGDITNIVQGAAQFVNPTR